MTESTKKLAKRDRERIYSMLENIAKIESHISERELRKKLYYVGVFVFRRYHDAGSPASMMKPGLKQPARVYSEEAGRFVHEAVAEYLSAEGAAAAAR